MSQIRHNWQKSEIKALFEKPFLDLVFEAASTHRKFHNAGQVQMSTLLSVKTGGCSEDCGYCPQAARHHTGVEYQPLMPVATVLEQAQKAKLAGSSRFCMGAAWREVTDGADFDQVIEMVKGVNALGLESCCTLGMVNELQAKRLGEAGLKYYNHNLDTSPEFYGEIISTRTQADRLNTLKNVREAGMAVCTGGIIGMGETVDDRVGLLFELATMNPHPESVPINALVAVEGTPLQNQKPVDPLEFVRMIAVSRILMPQSAVRLSAGRKDFSEETQALCFLAGANSIFAGDKLLTTPNPEFAADAQLLKKLGLETVPA
jgi:biotin synthase